MRNCCFTVDETGKRIRTNADHGPIKDYDSYVFDIYSKYVPQPVDINTCSVYDKYDILEEIGECTISYLYLDCGLTACTRVVLSLFLTSISRRCQAHSFAYCFYLGLSFNTFTIKKSKIFCLIRSIECTLWRVHQMNMI